MDSSTANSKEIPSEAAENAVSTPTETNTTNTQSVTNNINATTNPNVIATTTGNATTTTVINNSNSNQETDLAAMSNDFEVEESFLENMNDTITNSSASCLLSTSYNSISAPDTTIAQATTIPATATTPALFNQFITPQKSRNKSIQLHASASASTTSSSKKKRNKFSKCLSGNKNHTNNNNSNKIKNIGGCDGTNGDNDSSSSLSNVVASNIKTSLSMTSLPPDEKKESRDGIKAKLKMERPYNSLKKNADRNLTNQLANMHLSKSHAGNSTNACNRNSWGSGYSSSSLQSSAATLGIGSGKDDLWAAIQTNYNYIMDTNLLDTCKEARCEIEGTVSVLDFTLDKSFKLLDDNNRNVGSYEDPKELRKWLRDMEHKLENSPTLSEATMLTCSELQSHLNEHSVLYHEIVSHARVVSACIRAASEKEQKQQKQNQQQQQQLQHLQHDSYNTDASLIAEQTNSSLSSTDDTTINTNITTSTNTTTVYSSSSAATTSGVVCSTATTLSDQQISLNTTAAAPPAAATSGHTTKKSDNNSLERLQNRYHLLYLKAFEVQLWLDGLLRKKSSSVGNLTNEDLDSEDIDDSIDYSDDCSDDIDANDKVDGATEDDLNDVASDLESDITHNSLSYNDDLQQPNYNIHQQQQQRLQHHHKKQSTQQQQQKLQLCHSSDIDEIQTINVSSHHLQSSRDCIQNKIDCEDGDDNEDDVEIEEEAEDGDDEDEIDSPNNKNRLGYTKLLVTFDRSSGRSSASAQHKASVTLTDFEADSESSDLETIQRCMRSGNQRNSNKMTHYTPMSCKFLTNNSSGLITGHHSKRSTICGSVATVNLADVNTAINNATSELESCEVDDVEAATPKVITATLLNENLPHKCQQKQQQQYLKLQQKQRLTLMTITKNAMTTGSTTTTTISAATQSLGSTIATSTTNINSVNLGNSNSVSDNNSDSMSNISSVGVTANAKANGQSKNNIVTTKLLADNESNQQHHLKHHQQQNQQHQHKTNGGLALKQKNIAIISPISHNNFNNKHPQNYHHHHKNNKNNNNKINNNKSPTVLRKHHEHHHSSDISKFNRSNRKSKNCAIFYFKHLDTDNETNYSNSNCGDDGHDDCHIIAGGDSGNDDLVTNEHCYGNVNGVGVGVGAGVDDDVDDDDDGVCNDNIVGGLLSSSAASSSHTSDLLKSADASSDDECWLYTSSPVATNHQQQHSLGGIGNLNSNHTAEGILTSNELHSMDGGIQSSTVSSSTAATSVAAATVALSDDSDKENKEVKAACTTSLTQTHIHLATNETFVASTTVIDNNNVANINPVQLASNSGNPSSNSSISSVISSSCSSNDLLTEATTTNSSKTITTQILKYTTQQQGNPSNYRSEMELQINNNSNNNSSINNNTNNIRHQIMMKENILSTTANNQSTLATNMPDLVINHKNSSCNNNNHNNNNNNNCASSSSSLISNSLQHKRNHHCAAKTSSSCLQNSAAATTITADNDVNGNCEKENIRFYTRADICNISARPPNPSNDNNHHHHQLQHQQLTHVNGATASSLYGAQHLLHVNVGKRLPPRSPAKSSISHTSTNTSTSTISPTKGKVSHESIKQLVLEAEHLVRDEALKTPTKQKHSSSSNNNNNNNNNITGGGNIVQISTTVKKREIIMPGPIKRVQEWLEHQPATPVQMQKSSLSHHHTSDEHHRLLTVAPTSTAPSPTRTDDCEASGEASENDSIPQQCSDTSEVSDSIATCMQTSTTSYGNSTERIGGSAEPIVNAATSNQSLNVKIVKRQQNRRKSERPWSVSCLSQLTTDANQVAAKVKTISNVHSGLASHSISESALDSLSPGRPRASSSSAVAQVKSYDSKGSLKRRKTRKKKLSTHINGKKSDTNSEDNNNHQHHHAHYGHQPITHQEEVTLTPKQPPTLLMQTCENMTPQQIQEITQALIQLQNPDSTEQLQMAAGILQQHQLTTVVNGTTNESEEENQLMKPNFRVGSFTTAYMTNEARLGSLAALATYMNDDDQQAEYNTTGTEDHHSSFSETAWDNYQEKYNSENYSEGFDSDAARKLLEFGDDYRNFIDSQSDCCSSLSAANNLDSFSPPRMDSLQQNESKIITQDTIVSSVDHARRRRALELEYERRRKNLEIRRKSCQESLEYHNPKSPAATLSSSTQALTPKNSERFNFQHKTETATRKLEFGMSHSAQSLRRTSESDTSQRRRKADERRRSSRNLEKCIKLIPATSSSSGDDTDDEKEIRNLLQQSHNRLEDTKALKIRCHLLRPEDYTEIITTCRDNIRCLESVLKGPTSSVLSSQCVTQSKDLLAAWEDLLGWSENAAAARKLQEDMIVLKHALNRLGNKSSFELLDTEPSIQIAIEALKSEKTQLQTYRTSMLKLNASVHSWLTRQERRLQNALVEQQLNEAAVKVAKELLEQEGEIKSEHKSATTAKQQTATTAAIAASKQTMQEQIGDTTTTTTSTMITVTDSYGNELESHTGTATASTATNTVGTSTTTMQHQEQQLMHSSSSCSGSEKNWDLQSLIASETEFHKHLKDEVSDMYTAWDEADARINTQLEVLTSSLIAWRQLECGLSEFQLALGQDRGTLKGLEGALNTGQATPGELAQNVKLVAKLLSEKVNVSQEQLTAVQDYLDPNHILHIAKYTPSNGSLSDSGISDGGTTSDGGLSERERRLGVLRRLAKQLESALAPGSEAMKSIAARMESAENELKSLQNTCRDLIVRTAASHQNKKHQEQQQVQQESSEKRTQQNEEIIMYQPTKHQTNGQVKLLHDINGKLKQTIGEEETTTAHGLYTSRDSSKRNKRRNRRNSSNSNDASTAGDSQGSNAVQMKSTAAGDGGGDDPSDDPNLGYDLDTSDDELTPKAKKGWGWRIAKIAVPMQLALFAVYCAANLMQPNCCDNINNFSMSFTPQLRYIRGPPPI